MSDNKYIIDKDSLTGIANAVRNSLGNGEAITDEDAGYYPVSTPVGVRPPSIALLLSTGSTGTSTYGLRLESSQYESLYGDSPFSKIEIFGSYSDPGLSTSQVGIDINSADCTMTYKSSGKTFSAVGSFESPQNTLIMRGDTNGFISPSYSSDRKFTFSSMHFILKDADDNIIIPKSENLPITWNPAGSSETRTVVMSDIYYQGVMTPIPFSIDDIQNKITNYLGRKSGLIYRYHINPQSNESGTAFLGTPLSEMNVLDYGVTSVSQIKFMLIYGYNTSNSFTWYPANLTYTMIINGKPFYASDSSQVYWPNWTSDSRNPSYKLQLCSSKTTSWPLGLIRGTTSSYMGEASLQYPKIVFMVLDLEATE